MCILHHHSTFTQDGTPVVTRWSGLRLGIKEVGDGLRECLTPLRRYSSSSFFGVFEESEQIWRPIHCEDGVINFC